MTSCSVKSICIGAVLAVLCIAHTAKLGAQTPAQQTVQGIVHDAQGHPLPSVTISLEPTDSTHSFTTSSDEKGKFKFSGISEGSYTLRAKLKGYDDCEKGPIVVPDPSSNSVELLLIQSQSLVSGKDSSAIAFSDEPAFTVAGVTDTTALGGHGSGPIVRNSNALSKETASLAKGTASNAASAADPGKEAAVRAQIVKQDSAELHAELADIEEVTGRPLDAVKEYQRAAEMQPTEPHLFAWGAELLLHHAPEPAVEVFSKGHRLFPQSSRMMLGLGAAWYAQRSKEQAEKIVLEATDINPNDPTPYLFLGRLQVTEQSVPAAWAEKMKRFATLQPANPAAHYLYAVALLKQQNGTDHAPQAEADLKIAIQLDPKFGDAYLQLGILCSKREDYPAAVNALQKAIETTPVPDEAHYRLAQVYRHMGETEKANQEVALFKKISEQKEADAERERHEIPQFIYKLRGQDSTQVPN
jgi:tetratricopeptide (TPR) repeat protein